VTVAEALAHPLFVRARVVAGAAGLGRTLSWVHVAEIPHPLAFLRRGAMVLTTGVGLATPAARDAYAREVVEAGAAAIVFEAGPYSPGVPDEFRSVCEEAGVPLVVFEEETRFLDITQALNGALLLDKYAIFERLMLLQERVGAVLSQAEGIGRLLDVVAATVGTSVAFLPRLPGEDAQARGARAAELLGLRAVDRVLSRPTTVSVPIVHLRQSVVVLGQAEGDVVLVPEPPGEASELYVLAIGLVARSVGQEILRQHALAEDQRRQEASLVAGILSGDGAVLRSARRLLALRRAEARQRYVAVAAAVADPDRVARLYSRVRSGLRPLLAAVHDSQVLFVLAQADPAQARRRLEAFVAADPEAQLGVAEPCDAVEDLAAAFEQAMTALQSARPLSDARVRWYGELGAHRLLGAHSPADLWQRLVAPELGAILDPDRPDGGALVATLRALVEGDWDRSRAAARLGLSRQALYARLGRLEERLGPGFDRYPRSLDLALALAAHDAGGRPATTRPAAVGPPDARRRRPWSRRRRPPAPAAG
jgi:purine catabolism regulator